MKIDFKLSRETVMDMEVRSVLGMEVAYHDADTGRWRKGRIYRIGTHTAEVMDDKHVTRLEPIESLYVVTTYEPNLTVHDQIPGTEP